MSAIRVVGIVVLALGLIALAYGGFSYTETEEHDIGPIEIETKDRERVDVPLWAGIAAVVAGAGMLVAGGRRV